MTLLKRAMDDENRTHEAQIQEMRQKHTQVVEELTDQLEQTKRVGGLCHLTQHKWLLLYGLCLSFFFEVDILTLILSSFFQVKSNLEKAKQALEKETSDLTVEIRSLTQAKQDGEHKRKKLDGQLADLQSRFTDSEKQKAELGERCSKITVCDL